MIITINMRALGKTVDFKLDLDASIPHHATILRFLQQNRPYEEEILWVLLRVLNEGDFAVDVGAHIGMFTLIMSRLVGTAGGVMAFEPARQPGEQLLKNLEINGVGNVEFIKQPLWRCAERRLFHEAVDDLAGSALWPPGKWWENEKTRLNPVEISMNTVTLNDFLQLHPRVIKLDTEGADQAILEGYWDLHADHTPYVIVELNPFGMKQLDYSTFGFRAFMRARGYELFFLHPGDEIPSYVPPGTTVIYQHGTCVKNAMFSTIEAVAKAWPEAIN